MFSFSLKALNNSMNTDEADSSDDGASEVLICTTTERPKNTDIECHFISPKEKSCQICGKFREDIVKHYVQAHPVHEVYCSRLTTEMAKFGTEQKPLIQLDDGIHINAYCIFCRCNHSGIVYRQ